MARPPPVTAASGKRGPAVVNQFLHVESTRAVCTGIVVQNVCLGAIQPCANARSCLWAVRSRDEEALIFVRVRVLSSVDLSGRRAGGPLRTTFRLHTTATPLHCALFVTVCGRWRRRAHTWTSYDAQICTQRRVHRSKGALNTANCRAAKIFALKQRGAVAGRDSLKRREK